MQLSIITINYNNLSGLKQTIESVIGQTFKEYEYIIIDGGSNDGSQDYLDSMQSYFTICVSEPDNGIYDAMNKGISKAKGEYCMFLNSGDYLLEASVLQTVFCGHPTEDILYGDLKSEFREYLYPIEITLQTFFKGTIPHQASFIKTELFSKYGKYEERYPIIADWVFFVKAIMLHKVSYRHLEMYISFFEHGGISTEEKHNLQMKKERNEVLMVLFPQILPDYIHMSTIIDQQQKELNSYRNSRMIQCLRTLQSKVLKTR